VAALVGRLTGDSLRGLEDGSVVELEFDGDRIEILPDDVAIEREVTTDWLVQSAGPFVAAIDPNLDPALRQEGLAREVVSRVQRLRKEVGYQYTTRITLGVAGPTAVLDAVRAHREFIARETLARDLRLDAVLEPADGSDRASIDEHQVTLTVQAWTGGPSKPQV
jgi:isoleucyl-tRNA synthetase